MKKDNRKGFTLVELIVVLVILAVLAALLVPSLTGYIDKAVEKRIMLQVTMDDAMLALVQTRYLSEIARVRLDLATGAIVPDSAHWTKEDAEHPMKENLDELLIKEQ